ncbi:TolC family outer membrane protein [Maritimibacter dapengensis]|uniref:TolC family outer membrane protein n=1 Tax=Maritimibacter dapengensis TaxID=2836868 RepID=A0ABS6SYD9_9RHOB|nr:TolC family outer membrane protein [Maritimibacter dapengensis]MBV7377967.1 TolC family outer membrane protein [Maritimibacter dapengensis]
MRRFLAIVTALVLTTGFVTSGPARAESLSDAMVSAYKNSGLLEQQRALLRAEDENVAIAVSALRPVISYSATAGRTISDPVGGGLLGAPTDRFNASINLQAQLLLFDFGQTDQKIAIARESVMMAREMLVGVEQNVLLNAVQAYLNVLSAQESVALQGSSVRLITQELRAARDRFEVGEITQTDVSLAEARLAAARSAEAAAQGDLMVQREAYKAAVGRFPGNLAPPPSPPRVPDTLDAAKAQARARHPDILSAKRAVSSAEMSIELAKLSTRPTVSASATATRTFRPAATEARSLQGGVTLSGPIYSGGRLTALYRQAVAQAEAQRAGLLVTTQGIDQQVGNAWAQLAIATASLQATDRQIRASQVALRGAREEATLGARTTLDVLNAEQELLDARSSAISARYDQYGAIYRLLAAMGLLTADHLNLGIVSYDPEAYYNAVQDAPLRRVSPQGQKLEHILETLGK